MIMPDKCPHCRRGNLIDQRGQHLGWSYLCSACSRAWIILDDKYMLAGFSAGGEVYEINKLGRIIDHNQFKDDDFREKLWNRIGGYKK